MTEAKLTSLESAKSIYILLGSINGNQLGNANTASNNTVDHITIGKI